MITELKELSSEICGSVIGLATFVYLSILGIPSIIDMNYFITKIIDLSFSGLAALVSFIIVHVAKKSLESNKNNWFKSFVKYIIKKFKR